MIKYGCNLKTIHQMSKLSENMNSAFKYTPYQKVEWLSEVHFLISCFWGKLKNRPSSTIMYVQLMSNGTENLSNGTFGSMSWAHIFWKFWYSEHGSLATPIYNWSLLSDTQVSRVLEAFTLHYNQPKIKQLPK